MNATKENLEKFNSLAKQMSKEQLNETFDLMDYMASTKNVRIDKGLFDKVKTLSEKNGQSCQFIINTFVKQGLDITEKRKKGE